MKFKIALPLREPLGETKLAYTEWIHSEVKELHVRRNNLSAHLKLVHDKFTYLLTPLSYDLLVREIREVVTEQARGYYLTYLKKLDQLKGKKKNPEEHDNTLATITSSPRQFYGRICLLSISAKIT